MSKRVTVKIILVFPASILVGEWLQRQQHFWVWSLYVRSKWDTRYRLHCLVLTDIYLYNFTKGKTNHVNQRWCHTTCLQHPCYDLGCYPCTYIQTYIHTYIHTHSINKSKSYKYFDNSGPGPEVIKLEFILKLKIKCNGWMLADTCQQAANHCSLFWAWDCTEVW